MPQTLSRIVIVFMTSSILISGSQAFATATDMVVGEVKVIQGRKDQSVVVCLNPVSDESANSELALRNSINGAHTIFAGSAGEIKGHLIRCGQKQLAETGLTLELVCLSNGWFSTYRYSNHTVQLRKDEVAGDAGNIQLTEAAHTRVESICKSSEQAVYRYSIRNSVK